MYLLYAIKAMMISEDTWVLQVGVGCLVLPFVISCASLFVPVAIEGLRLE